MNPARCPLQAGDEGAILLSYLDRQLDSGSMAALDRHVAQCPDCARVVESQRAVWQALDAYEPQRISADFDDQVMARIAAERPWWVRMMDAQWLGGRGHWWKMAMPLTAACLALVAVAVWKGGGEVRTPVSMDSTEVQQVEDALADVEMLRQLGVTGESQPL
ncbi:MAG: zf-HC2 domain-containing protein [Bryobacterales bacterium]|nr:zf-HC2 domain-containing protein [Bryobacterales bacterium]